MTPTGQGEREGDSRTERTRKRRRVTRRGTWVLVVLAFAAGAAGGRVSERVAWPIALPSVLAGGASHQRAERPPQAVHAHRPGAGTAEVPPGGGRDPVPKARVGGTESAPQGGSPELPAAWLLNVAPQDQYPQLPNGCEVTSLSMLLGAVGHPMSKLTLAKEMPVDPTPRVMGRGYQIQSWGNPNVGFVGSVYQAANGYGIYHGPMVRFLNRLLPGRAVDLTGQPFADILAWVARGVPVEVWTTTTFRPTTDWVTWMSPEGPVHATPLEHAVLVVGYDSTQIFVNNPLNGRKAQPVARGPFIQAWKQLGQQAITVRS